MAVGSKLLSHISQEDCFFRIPNNRIPQYHNQLLWFDIDDTVLLSKKNNYLFHFGGKQEEVK